MNTSSFLRALAVAPVLWLGSSQPVLALARTVPFQPVVDPANFDVMYNQKIRPIDRLFTTGTDYRSFFGHAAPGVDWSREWVVLYSAGRVSTGGFQASIRSIQFEAATGGLSIATRLEVPGQNCPVTMALDTPFVLVKLPIPPLPTNQVAFSHQITVKNCP